jgi:hypothetical protein
MSDWAELGLNERGGVHWGNGRRHHGDDWGESGFAGVKAI